MYKNNFKNIKMIFCIISLLCLFFVILAFSFNNSSLHKLSKVSDEINSINQNLSSAINNNKLDINKATITLQDNLNKFNEIKNTLNDMKVSDKYSNVKNALLSYVDCNISLYKTSLKIINNTDLKSFSNLSTNLFKAEQNIITSVNNSKKYQINFSFPKEANLFFLQLNSYLNDSFKINREKDIIYSQKQDFLLSIKSLLKNFSYLKEDLQPALKNIKNNKRDLSILLSDIKDKQSKYLKIKENSYLISLPQGSNECHLALIEMLNAYDIYLNSLKQNISYDIENSNSKDSNILDTIQNNYKDSFDKYNSFLSYYSNLEKTIRNYQMN